MNVFLKEIASADNNRLRDLVDFEFDARRSNSEAAGHNLKIEDFSNPNVVVPVYVHANCSSSSLRISNYRMRISIWQFKIRYLMRGCTMPLQYDKEMPSQKAAVSVDFESSRSFKTIRETKASFGGKGGAGYSKNELGSPEASVSAEAGVSRSGTTRSENEQRESGKKKINLIWHGAKTIVFGDDNYGDIRQENGFLTGQYYVCNEEEFAKPIASISLDADSERFFANFVAVVPSDMMHIDIDGPKVSFFDRFKSSHKDKDSFIDEFIDNNNDIAGDFVKKLKNRMIEDEIKSIISDCPADLKRDFGIGDGEIVVCVKGYELKSQGV